MEYKHTEAMGEISGFGGEYEATCQDMLDAGVKYLLANPEKNPDFKVFKNIYGLTTDENADAKELQDVLLTASKGDCTGAMMQAVMGRVMYVRKNGWEKYCEEVVKFEREQEEKKND